VTTDSITPIEDVSIEEPPDTDLSGEKWSKLAVALCDLCTREAPVISPLRLARRGSREDDSFKESAVIPGGKGNDNKEGRGRTPPLGATTGGEKTCEGVRGHAAALLPQKTLAISAQVQT